MEGRTEPVEDVGDQSVLHRIEMNVIHVGSVVAVVANSLLPEASLPNAALVFFAAASGTKFALEDAARETCFDRLPAGGEVLVEFRESPETVHVLV